MELRPSEPSTKEGGANTGTAKTVASTVINFGKKLVGATKYVFGGGRSQKDIDSGKFDCSSFVHYAFKKAGMDLGPLTSVTTETLKNKGKAVDSKNMQPGDLIFFDTYKKDGHVAIYMGDGKFIGAQSSTGVGVQSINDSYWGSKFNGRVRRLS